MINWKNPIQNETSNVNSLSQQIFLSNRPQQNHIYQEYNSYFLVPINEIMDPFEFWRVNEKTFPSIADLARILLCILNSQANVERVFSIAGLILNLKRCSMSKEHIARSVRLKKNFIVVRKLKQKTILK